MGATLTKEEATQSGRAVYEKICGPPPGKFLDTTHGITHYLLEGEEDSSTLVVLQHGLGGNTGVWDKITADLVDHGHRVLRYDLYDRGYSESDPHRYPIAQIGVHPLDFTLDVYTEQLVDVLKGLGLENEPMIHIGHSNGGVIGIGYAAVHTDKVKGLVLVDAVCLPVTKPLVARIADLPLLGNMIVRNLGASTFNKFARGSVVDPDGNAEIRLLLQRQGRNTLENPRFFAAVRSTNGNCLGFTGTAESLYRNCAQAKIPIHLLWGKEDTGVPYESCVKLHEIAKEVGTVITEEAFEGMPHNVFFADGKPEECSKSICNFVSKVNATYSRTPIGPGF